MEVGLGPGHIVLNGDPAPLPKRGRDQTAGWTKMPLGTEVGLGPGDIVLDVDPVPPQKKGHSAQFSANVHCGQTTVYIRISLGMEVGLSIGYIVLDGDPALPPLKGHSSVSSFRPMSIVATATVGYLSYC